jgi:hypothetical protein
MNKVSLGNSTLTRSYFETFSTAFEASLKVLPDIVDNRVSKRKHMDLNNVIRDAMQELLEIARFTLQEQRAHLPTVVLHCFEGRLPIVLPYRDDEEKRDLIAYVKDQALKVQAYAVTTITSAKVVNSRTGGREECLVLGTAVQGGPPHVMIQYFTRDPDTKKIEFHDMIQGDEAMIPGQMLVFPDWDDEVCH